MFRRLRLKESSKAQDDFEHEKEKGRKKVSRMGQNEDIYKPNNCFSNKFLKNVKQF